MLPLRHDKNRDVDFKAQSAAVTSSQICREDSANGVSPWLQILSLDFGTKSAESLADSCRFYIQHYMGKRL